MNNDEQYFMQYKAIYKKVDEKLDIRGSVLTALVQICINNNGTLPLAARERFKFCVPDSYYDYIEIVAKEVLQASH